MKTIGQSKLFTGNQEETVLFQDLEMTIVAAPAVEVQ